MRAADEAEGQVAPTRDAAISALFLTEGPRLIAMGQLIAGDRAVAEDLVQDAFVALFRRWSWLRDKDAARNYLTAAVTKGAKRSLRQRYAARDKVRRMQLERQPELPSPEATALLGEQRGALAQALQELPLRQRQVIVLRYYADRSESEIAEILAIAPGSVKRHASRALASLTQVLEVTP